MITPAVTAMALLASQAWADDGILHEGTPVRLKLNRTISSASEHLGDTVDFDVLDDIKASGGVVIPHGSTAIATVTEAVPKGFMGKGGKLNVNIDFVRLPSGEKLPLRGVQGGKGGGHTGAMTGAMVGTAIVFWPAAPLFLFIKGKDITIPQGHEVTVYTNSDYTIGSQPTTPYPTRNTVVSGALLTNADIVVLKEAGFGEQILIEKVKSTPGRYHLETRDLISLKNAGVPDTVVAAMLEAKR